ncbi:MAG TPA: DNA primase [Stellaceae bacterium]|nr:DNA primase [Stellaceae bacterium]
MALPPSFLEELRSRISLAEVVSRRVRLQKRGREYVGLCPFHKEKTPSFTVVEEKAFFHCFGCGAHGDVVGFTMRMGNLGFREAVDTLAKEAGLAVPMESERERDRYRKTQTLYDVCEAACRLFERQLTEAAGRGALDYLRRRGLSEDTIRAFRLGFALSSRTSILRALGKDFPQALLIEAGLLRSNEETGEVYDFFRGRVIFPIADHRGRIIAFGGRVLNDDSPKYLNSPDTPIFDKGRSLFGAHLARGVCAAGTQPIAVEGYMDVITLHSRGFRSAVAPLGTALTEHQLIALWHLGSEPILCFDGDAAGQRASVRALDRALPLLRPEFTCRFARLPSGDDPDSFLRSAGPDQFRLVLESAQPLHEFLWHSEIASGGYGSLNSPYTISKLEARLRKRVASIDNRIVQRNYNLFVSDQLWERRFALRRQKYAKKGAVRSDQGTDRLSFPDEIRRIFADASQKHALELIMVATAINHPSVVRSHLEKFVLVDPVEGTLRQLWSAIADELGKERENYEDLRDRLADRGQSENVEKVLSSNLCAAQSFCRFGTEQGWVTKNWLLAFRRYEIPILRRQQDEVYVRWQKAPNEENWQSVEVFRQIIAQYTLDEDHMDDDTSGHRPVGSLPQEPRGKVT